jgi:hypothetical protein
MCDIEPEEWAERLLYLEAEPAVVRVQVSSHVTCETQIPPPVPA